MESQQFILQYPLCCHPRYHRPETELSIVEEDPMLGKSENTKKSLLQFEFKLRLRLVNKSNDFVEEFGFNSPSSNDKQFCLIANHFPELRCFARWFLKENKRAISFLEESSVNLANLIGPDFYKNRILEADPSYRKRQKFLKELGVETKLTLSQVELDTIRLLVKGYTASQIGKELYRSKRTIEHRVENIKAKLECSSKIELVQKIRELELLGIGLQVF